MHTNTETETALRVRIAELEAAHLATQRALCDAMDMIAKCDDGLLKGKRNDRYVILSVVRDRVGKIWGVACAARAAVAQADKSTEEKP